MNKKPSEKISSFTRRSLLRLWLSTSFMAFFPRFSYSQQVAHVSHVSKDILMQFQKWSHIATGFSGITLNETREYLEFCLNNGLELKDISKLETKIYKGTPLEKKLLEGWMTGLMHLHGGEINRYYDTMLMWRAVGLDIKPLRCQNHPRSWSLAPLE